MSSTKKHLMRVAVHRLKRWADTLAKARAAGDEQQVREAQEFVDEYTRLIEEMKADDSTPQD